MQTQTRLGTLSLPGLRPCGGVCLLVHSALRRGVVLEGLVVCKAEPAAGM